MCIFSFSWPAKAKAQLEEEQEQEKARLEEEADARERQEEDEAFDTSCKDQREQAIWQRFRPASLQKAPKLDPPSLEDTRGMVREDTHWYISAAFVKIFQTGEGDYWAYAKAREDRGRHVSLQDWVKCVLMGRDGRALRHPRFFYFAVITILLFHTLSSIANTNEFRRTRERFGTTTERYKIHPSHFWRIDTSPCTI